MKKLVSILTAIMLIAGISVFAAGCGSSGSDTASGSGSNSGTESKSSGKSEVNLNDYLIVSFYGMDGEGMAEYGFDSMGFVDDCSDMIAYKDSEPSASAAMSLSQYLSDGGSFDVSEGLSNGDKVVFIWSLDEDELSDTYEMNFKWSDAEYTVEDLLMSELPEGAEEADGAEAEGEEQAEAGPEVDDSESEIDEDNPMEQARREAQDTEGEDKE